MANSGNVVEPLFLERLLSEPFQHFEALTSATSYQPPIIRLGYAGIRNAYFYTAQLGLIPWKYGLMKM
jgi:hypothetical protein